MIMRELGNAFKALGRGVYSVFSIARDVEVRDTSILL